MSDTRSLSPTPREMTAAVLYGREDVRVERVPVPAVGPGEVRIRIRAALTCGTDVKVFRRGYHARMIVPPTVFGHEFAGEIEAVGAGMTDWAPGMRVVAANSAPCSECFYCLRNTPELCEDLQFVNGAYAEYITLPERMVRVNLLPLPDHLAYEEAALVEPLACVVHGVEKTGVESGETIAILGVGPIGLLFVRLCKLAGARVIAVGRRPERLAVAEAMGADVLISQTDAAQTGGIVETVRRETEGGRGPDRVIECVGLPEAWEQAIAIGRKAATIQLFGGCPKDALVRLDTTRLHYDELTLKGTFHHTPAAVRRALALIANGDIPARQFIQGHAPLSELPAVLKSLCDSNTAVKIAIETE